MLRVQEGMSEDEIVRRRGDEAGGTLAGAYEKLRGLPQGVAG